MFVLLNFVVYAHAIEKGGATHRARSWLTAMLTSGKAVVKFVIQSRRASGSCLPSVNLEIFMSIIVSYAIGHPDVVSLSIHRLSRRMRSRAIE